ncbi:signal peptidase I [Sulfobacillus acidophilus]|uniref:Signal peptidase I n=1 Tax=Sulfobacillus acidophilus TaxID=53633 RepID=A0ABS3AVA4_9FIRM|nr:signal peptidase I [Sulfobacillus acidophilus]
MREKLITPGRIIALFCALFLLSQVWDFVFSPGGIGSNIILGIFLAVFGVYYITVHLGGFIDDLLFNKGSRKRAVLIRAAAKSLAEHRHSLKIFIKKNKKQLNTENVDFCNLSLNELEKLLTIIKACLTKEPKPTEEQIKNIEAATNKVKGAFVKLLGKQKEHSFLTGAKSLGLALLAAIALRVFIVEPFQIPSGSMIPTLLVGDHLFVSKLKYGIVNPFAKGHSYFIRWSEPKPGDVIVFQAPNYVGTHAGAPWIKRVVAGPNQSIKIVNTVVYVDDKPYPHIAPEELVSYMDYFGASERNGAWEEEEAISTKEQINEIVHYIYMRTPQTRNLFEDNWPLLGMHTPPGLTCVQNECKVKDDHVFVMGDNRGNSTDSRVWGALPISAVKGKALFIWMSVDGSQTSFELGRFVLPKFRFDRWFKNIK